ncbi:MAG: DUF1559 domain-containing protein [Planctomycetota bacterium]
MAGMAFKQQCPSCEHQVPIRDASLVGKKIECPSCKYRFVVQKPARVAADDDTPPATRPVPVKAGKPGKTGAIPVNDDNVDEPVADKPGSSKKLFVGLGLGGVGLLVLALASFFILGKSSPPKRNPPPFIAKGAVVDDPDEEKPEGKPEVKKKIETTTPKIDDTPLTPSGPWLTNLLPGDTEHVFHGFFKNVFDVFNPYRASIVGDQRGLADGVFKPRLGFAISDIDDFVRADRFTGTPWTFTVVHLKAPIDEQAVTKAFGLKAMSNIKGHEYYKASKANPWFDHLSRIAIGVPEWLRNLGRDENKPMFVRFHGPQTMIFASEVPLRELLTNDLKFPLLSGTILTQEPKQPSTEPAPKAEPKDLGPLSIDTLIGTVWAGTENRPGAKFGSLQWTFVEAGNKVTMTTPAGTTSGTYELADQQVVMTFSSTLKYTGKFEGKDFKGEGQLASLTWKFSVRPAVAGPVVEKIDNTSAIVQERQRLRLSYLTIKPKLKEMLDRLEFNDEGSTEKRLFSTASDLEAARVPNDSLPEDYRNKFVWRGKQIWDLTALLDERKPRLAMAGSSLLQRDERVYQYRNEFECHQEKEAADLLKVTKQIVAPEFAGNVNRYLKHRVDIGKTDIVLDPNDPANKEAPSRWSATQNEHVVDIRVDLTFDPATHNRTQGLVNLFVFAVRSEVELAVDPRSRHRLGQAAVTLAEKGDTKRQIPPGSFPPGTLKRPSGASRGSDTPYYRLSWMTTLLPYLGHDSLYQRIDFTSGWREPSNWLAAKTIVPEFLDASYPVSSRHVFVPGLGVSPATTHVVGIAGVGLDAADDNRDNPATAKTRGVFSYDRSATLEEIQKGRGAANVIMMMQIPYDGITGVSPWIAGGGGTVRGVPTKNSIAPFVLSNDKDGKPIVNKGKRGSYAIMADGSVRFIDASVPDDVFKALATINGPAPKVDFFTDERLPIIPDPAAKAADEKK